MAKFTIGIVGLGKTINKFKNIEKLDLSEAFNHATVKVQRKAKDYAPVGTPESTGIKGYIGGRLKDSIMRKPYKGGSYKNGGLVYTNTEYAVYQEFGTKFMPPSNNGRGFLRASVLDLDAEIKEDMKKFIQNKMEKYGI
jgi:HK97 gp10 family phage protein